mmetsp:Transcript_17030/g.47160  ORF Transcript_17030/g.47160 Transcript_17030/m.47160 type:complete len:80 (-) Transcript_17030:315-554(-)
MPASPCAQQVQKKRFLHNSLATEAAAEALYVRVVTMLDKLAGLVLLVWWHQVDARLSPSLIGRTQQRFLSSSPAPKTRQ